MSYKNKSFFPYMLLILVMIFLTSTGIACTKKAPKKEPAPKQTEAKAETITLATTTSTEDSGLLDVLIPAFEKKHDNKIKVKVVAVGTGQAIEIGEKGDADVLLVHARASEDEFVAKGYGTDAWDVMYNQFLIVGPKDDPAGVALAKTSVEAFQKIASGKSTFISRGDESGTHKKELSLWEKAKIKPEGSWYISSGQGMGETLKMAEEKNAYTLTDEATFLTNKTTLVMVYKGDQDLYNPYGIIKVKSTKKGEAADKLIDFFVSSEGQKRIGDFGKDKYNKSIFVPQAKKRT